MQLSTETAVVPTSALPAAGVLVPEDKAQEAKWELAPDNGNLIYARIGDILVVYNPRQYFEPKAMAELVISIRAQGILQPLLVRPKDGRFELIAGERRLRGALEAYGPDGVIPVYSREMTDAEAAAAAAAENIQREGMSATEESGAAVTAMGLYGGDRNEVAKRLGWSMPKLESRLALQNCTPTVQEALNERKISLGHAELLAAVPKNVQTQILPLIIEKKISVHDLKNELASQALRLDNARFDKSECLSCHHNSSNQRALFAEAIDDGRCTKKSCFDEKNEALIESVKKSLEGQYQRIQVVRPGDNHTVIALKADGDTGVGAEQAEACKGCANFGALISAVPGKVGQAFRNYCMDVACNKEKNTAYLATLTPPSTGSGKGSATTSGKTGAASGSTQKGKTGAKPTISAESPRVKDYREKTWREVVRTVILRSSAKTDVLIITLAAQGLLRHIDDHSLAEQVRKASGGKVGSGVQLKDSLNVVHGLDETPRSRLLDMIAWSVVDKIQMSEVKALASFLEVDFASHWKVCSGLFDVMTKAEIEAVCQEIGLKQHLDKQFSKIISGKRDEMIKGLLATSDFDFHGKVPAVMLLK
ncbi:MULTISPECIES: PRTRC system ParB family protein [Ralstonia]|jgi:ParB family chromosome partitioning protein|uniref:PRTRC system ParB family protein n=3 Tax=Pseudomonadota TaxID=1224 RepID=R0E6L7_RALPI|nr:PRTRC system ParB family protein [Ralstonia pickettii]ENZ77749.1 PRTRC system ParB family protein [Ralstonia pickettii OR214]